MTEEQIKTVLKTVLDPELGINIVDLGLLYKITIATSDTLHDSRINILMTLTTPGCPLGGWFVEQVKQAVASGLNIDEDQVMVEITFDPPWSQELMTEEAKAELGF
jgi:metal-sulfur cluster biosynthetic enzyme